MSLRYFYYMNRSKYWVNNMRQPMVIPRRPETKLVATWHGTPLKRLVFDMDDVHAFNPRYKNIVLSDDDGLKVEVENGSYVPVSRLSVGTIDQMYLSLRLSAISEITKETMPIILDEAFVKVNPTSNKDMGLIMREVTPKLKGKADMSEVSKLIKERLRLNI